MSYLYGDYYYDRYRTHYPSTHVETKVINEAPRKTRRTIAPQVKITVEDITTICVQDGEVVVMFEGHEMAINSEYTYKEIEAAIEGLCYYRDKDGVQTCVLHEVESEYPLEKGPFRRCLNNDHAVQRARREAEVWREMVRLRMERYNEDMALLEKTEESEKTPARKRRRWFSKN